MKKDSTNLANDFGRLVGHLNNTEYDGSRGRRRIGEADVMYTGIRIPTARKTVRGREGIDGNMNLQLPASLMEVEWQKDAGYLQSGSRDTSGKPYEKAVTVRFAAPGWPLLLSEAGGGDDD